MDFNFVNLTTLTLGQLGVIIVGIATGQETTTAIHTTYGHHQAAIFITFVAVSF